MTSIESKEQIPLREYSSLDDKDKVHAILGAVLEPVSKQFAIGLSGINYEEMDDEQRIKVDSIFTRVGIETTEESVGTKYRLSDEEREKLSRRVDMKTVHGAMADKLWGELGLETF